MLRRRLQPRRHRRAAPRLLVQLAPSAFSGRASRARPLRRNAPGSARHRRLYPPASRGRAGSHAQLRARVSKASARRIPAVRLQPALQRPLGKLQQPLRAEEQDLRSGVRERIPGLRRRVSLEYRGAAERDAGVQRTGRLAKVAGWTASRGHARRPSELAPIGAGCRQADCHSHAAEPPHRVPPRPSIDIHVGKRAAPDQPPVRQQAAARAGTAKPGAKRRQGEAQRPPRQGGLRVGVGGRCNQT